MIGHIVQIILYSIVATVLLLPVSVLDGYYIATFNNYPFLITLPTIIIIDVIVATLLYLFAKTLSRLIIRKEKHKKKLEKIDIEKIGFWGLVLGASTPLPYSLMLYAAGSVQWSNYKKVALAVLIGRTIKYSVITIGILLF